MAGTRTLPLRRPAVRKPARTVIDIVRTDQGRFYAVLSDGKRTVARESEYEARNEGIRICAGDSHR